VKINYGFKNCSTCGREYWYPTDYRHWDIMRKACKPDDGLCQSCSEAETKRKYARKYRKDHARFDDPREVLLTLEDDELFQPLLFKFWR